MKRIAILGASGQLGKLLSSSLSSLANVEIIRLSRNTSLGPEGYVIFDPEKDAWEKIGKVDILINVAGIIQESKDADFEKVHIHLTQKIVENRNVIGNPKIIHVSVLGANPEHPIAFLRTKGEADAILLKQQNTYVLRPSIVCVHDTLLVKKFKMMFDISKVFFQYAVMPTQFRKTRIQPLMAEDFTDTIIKLCETDFDKKIINCTGAEEISFDWLLKLASEERKQKMIPIEIPKNLVASVTKNFISVWFPDLLNYDQFQLLFKDNIASNEDIQRLLGRPTQSTLEFWKKEFQN